MKKTKTILLYIALFVLIISSVGVIVYSLIANGVIVIPKKYEPKYVDLEFDELGSAKFLDGRTAWVSVFVSDAATEWDFTDSKDVERRDEMLSYYSIAADWLTEQGKKYDKTLEFVYARGPEDPLLYYETRFTADLYEDNFDKLYYASLPDEWAYIDRSIDNDAVKLEYGCDNIVYIFFLNTPDEYPFTGVAFVVCSRPTEYPYEVIYIPCDKSIPATIAHETLHAFGAADLYAVDGFEYNYCQPFALKSFCEENFPTDIMLTTTDTETGEKLKDRITREITDITAYYIGWIDKPPFDVDGMEMLHSQFEKKQ